MKRSTLSIAISIAALLAFTACQSAPEPEPAPAPAPPPPRAQVSQAELAQEHRDEAQRLRQQIVDADLAQYSPEDFERGNVAFELGENQRATDAESAIESYRRASDNYRAVIERAFDEVIAGARTDAQSAQARADEVRAARGAPTPYRRGESRFSDADAAREQREFTPALEGYRDAQSAFEEAFEIASERRARAREAMDSADRAIEQTEGRAQSLESELETEE